MGFCLFKGAFHQTRRLGDAEQRRRIRHDPRAHSKLLFTCRVIAYSVYVVQYIQESSPKSTRIPWNVGRCRPRVLPRLRHVACTHAGGHQRHTAQNVDPIMLTITVYGSTWCLHLPSAPHLSFEISPYVWASFLHRLQYRYTIVIIVNERMLLGSGGDGDILYST